MNGTPGGADVGFDVASADGSCAPCRWVGITVIALRQSMRARSSGKFADCSDGPEHVNVCRHLATARTHRILRAEAFAVWREAVTVAA